MGLACLFLIMINSNISPKIQSGWLVIDKAPGLTSFEVIKQLRRMLPRGTKLGHAGTLDPDAYGVLVVAIGEATKLISNAQEGLKRYRFFMHWGENRDTDDDSGEVVARSQARPSLKEIIGTLDEFTGAILQQPPIYSAKKIQGKRACDRVRAGEDIPELKPCPVTVHSFKLLEGEDLTDPGMKVDKVRAEIVCSKGTYVRSLARDLGQKLGCYGYASGIHRIQVGPFCIDHALTLEKLASFVKKGILSTVIQSPQAVLDDIPAVVVASDFVDKVRLGQSIVIDTPVKKRFDETVRVMDQGGNLVALGSFEGGTFAPKRVFAKPDVNVT